MIGGERKPIMPMKINQPRIESIKMNKYPIIIDYSLSQANRLKKFCRLTGVTIKSFVRTSLENEIAYQLGEMPPEKKKAVERLLNEK